MEAYFKTEALSVGYHGRALLENIDLALEKGRILTLIGPNGGGKSTILKSITRHLQTISGRVFVGGRNLASWQPRELARKVAVVLTDRVKPELTTCAQVVALGRYPHTGIFGKLGAAIGGVSAPVLAVVAVIAVLVAAFVHLWNTNERKM